MRKPKKRQITQTSSFGAGGRVCHDSTRFYNSRLYEQQAAAPRQEAAREQPVPPDVLDMILCKSSENMAELPDESIALMVTSPPYNASKEYDENLNLPDYLTVLSRVWRETWRVLAEGGRACINLANLGRKPYIPLHAFVIDTMLETGFNMRGEIIWNKGGNVTISTAWGSWCSASNPVLRDVHEYILVFSKGSFTRSKVGRQSTIERDDFLEWTKSVWSFPSVTARQIGHPAPFPEELPRRLIQLYTFLDDVVLDPFMGSGTTALAARAAGRHYVGYEIDPEYVTLAARRLEDQK